MPSKLSQCNGHDDLAIAIGLTPAQLRGLLKHTNNKYKTFFVRKRSGEQRPISAPDRELKNVQRAILDLLSELHFHRDSSHGFIRARSIKTNAAPHVGRRHLINADLSDFFGSIHPGRVEGALRAKPFQLAAPVAKIVTRLCTYNNGLPQGAPTSPALANLVAWTLDRELERLAKKNRCFYTRYADDLTFSTNARAVPLGIFDPATGKLGKELTDACASCGFLINEKKTRHRGTNSRQTVTGLVTNMKTNVDRRFIREARGRLKAVEAYGVEAAQAQFDRIRGPARSIPILENVRGMIAFLGTIRGRGNDTYRALAARYNRFADIKRLLPVQPTRLDALKACVWVIETDEHPDCVQGTGFWLDGVGLVTNAHVLRDDSFGFSISAPNEHHALRVVAKDEVRDLAILTTDRPPEIKLKRGDPTRLGHLSPVQVIGFPDYAPGADISIKQTAYAGRRNRGGVQGFTIDSGVTAGNSGGPVLNTNDEVVGIAASGGSDLSQTRAAIEYGVISVVELDALSRA
ncbi:MAG: reverse transcriptase domain-containing protein [Archangium sp.]